MSGGNVLTMRDPEEAFAEIRRRREDTQEHSDGETVSPQRAMRTAESYLRDLTAAIHEGRSDEAVRLLNFSETICDYLSDGRARCDCDD